MTPSGVGAGVRLPGDSRLYPFRGEHQQIRLEVPSYLHATPDVLSGSAHTRFGMESLPAKVLISEP